MSDKGTECFQPIREPETRRDRFAAAALTGLLANPNFQWDLARAYTPDESVAKRAFEIADAMLGQGP
jgi:hypothetical protein